MDEPSDLLLCEVCHQQPASLFACIIKEGSKSSRRLCQTCFETTAGPEEIRRHEQAAAARCRFCGKHPCSPSSNFNFLTGIMETKSTCLPCEQLHANHLLAVLEKIPENLSTEEQVKAAHHAQSAADEHVRNWLRRYGS